MTHYIITAWDRDGRVLKFDSFDSEATAVARLAEVQDLGFTDAFRVVDPTPDVNIGPFWIADPVAKSISVDVEALAGSRRGVIKAHARAYADELEFAGFAYADGAVSAGPDAVARLQGLLARAERLEAAGQAVDLRGRTDTGDNILISSAAEAGALFDSAAAHIAAVQEALDDLYDAIDGMDLAELKAFRVGKWAGWPA